MRRVALVRISNVLGIEDAEIRPGKVTLLEGGNATGKTSHVEAPGTAIEEGYDTSST